jgi:hypothetical protein
LKQNLGTLEECFSGRAGFASVPYALRDFIRSRLSAGLRNASGDDDKNTIAARLPQILFTARSATTVRRSGGQRIPATGSGTAKRIPIRPLGTGLCSKPETKSAVCAILQTTTWLWT